MAQFKAALGLRPENPDPPVPSRFETTTLNLTSDTLLTNAMARNPRIRAVEAEVRQAEASIALARKNRLPDWTVGLQADAKTSPALYRPQFSATLPIWRDKLAAQIAEAQYGKQSVQARLSAEQIALVADFADKSFSYRENSRTLSLVNERLLPKARMALEVSRSAYLSGQTDFLNVIDAQRALLDFELTEVETRVEREIDLAELSLLIAGQAPPGTPGASITTNSNNR
jgi:outer membrane protein TolC